MSRLCRVEPARERLVTVRISNKVTPLQGCAVPGDRIGQEVVPEGVRMLEEVGRRFSLSFGWGRFPWTCEHYQKTGEMLAACGHKMLRKHAAIYLGAVGFPCPIMYAYGDCCSRSAGSSNSTCLEPE